MSATCAPTAAICAAIATAAKTGSGSAHGQGRLAALAGAVFFGKRIPGLARASASGYTLLRIRPGGTEPR